MISAATSFSPWFLEGLKMRKLVALCLIQSMNTSLSQETPLQRTMLQQQMTTLSLTPSISMAIGNGVSSSTMLVTPCPPSLGARLTTTKTLSSSDLEIRCQSSWSSIPLMVPPLSSSLLSKLDRLIQMSHGTSHMEVSIMMLLIKMMGLPIIISHSS